MFALSCAQTMIEQLFWRNASYSEASNVDRFRLFIELSIFLDFETERYLMIRVLTSSFSATNELDSLR